MVGSDYAWERAFGVIPYESQRNCIVSGEPGQSSLSSSFWLVIAGHYCQCDSLSGNLDMVEAGRILKKRKLIGTVLRLIFFPELYLKALPVGFNDRVSLPVTGHKPDITLFV